MEIKQKINLTHSPRKIDIPLIMYWVLPDILVLLGVIIICIGFILSFFIVPYIDFETYFLFKKNSVTVTDGTIISLPEKTNFNFNNKPVYRYTYSYVADNKKYSAKSYVTGKQYRSRDIVKVTYIDNNPAKSKIKKSFIKPLPIETSVILLFPVIGIACLIIGIVKRLKKLHILKYGILTEASCVEKSPTSGKIRGKTVYNLKFQFKSVSGETHNVTVKTHLTDTIDQISNDDNLILYNRNNPQQVLLPDILTDIKVQPDGTITVRSKRSFFFAVMPVFIIVILSFIYFILFKIKFFN